jgi:hypothetical protein
MEKKHATPNQNQLETGTPDDRRAEIGNRREYDQVFAGSLR